MKKFFQVSGASLVVFAGAAHVVLAMESPGGDDDELKNIEKGTGDVLSSLGQVRALKKRPLQKPPGLGDSLPDEKKTKTGTRDEGGPSNRRSPLERGGGSRRGFASPARPHDLRFGSWEDERDYWKMRGIDWNEKSESFCNRNPFIVAIKPHYYGEPASQRSQQGAGSTLRTPSPVGDPQKASDSRLRTPSPVGGQHQADGMKTPTLKI